MASRNETNTIGHNTHVSERVLRELSEQWNFPESEAAQQLNNDSIANYAYNEPPPLLPDSDDEDYSDDEV